MEEIIDGVMSNVLFHGMYNQDQNIFYKRSVYSLRGNCSMTDSEVQQDLQGTLERLDQSKDGSKTKIETTEASVSIWTYKRRLGITGLMSLFFVLLLINGYQLIVLCKHQYALSHDVGYIRTITREYHVSIALIEELDCLLRVNAIVCPYTVDRVFRESIDDNEMMCMRQEVKDELEILRNTLHSNKTAIYNPVSKLIRIVKTCMDKIMQLTISISNAKTGSSFVPVSKLIHATFLAFHRFLFMMMHCNSFDTQIDYSDFVTELNFATGNLDSLFMKENHDVAIYQMHHTKLVILVKVLQSNDSSKLCLQKEWRDIILLPLNLKNVALGSLNFINNESQAESNLNILFIILYICTMSCVPIMCIVMINEFKKLFLLISDLQLREDLISHLLEEEKFEFRSILSEIIPPSKFCDVLPNEDLKLPKIPIRKNTNRPTSFPDSTETKTDVVVKRLSEMSKINKRITPYKTSSHMTMTTIVEGIPSNNSHGKVSKEISDIAEVTIYCSDIVGFNDIIRHFAPKQIINTVSYLVNLFNDRTKLYDVFVVGRDVNAFTVLSGITSEQKLRHASEIVNMALDIRAVCSDLELETGSNPKLRLRMAIHTGSCYCSSSSFPTPRYNTSGDIFRVVKKLLKSTTPNRILVSETTYQILHKHFSYNLQKWEPLTTHHDQTMKTYQLNGRRFSEEVSPNNFSGRRITWTPIELEQKALYRFEADDMRYVPPPAWLLPTRSQSRHSERSHFSHYSENSIDSARTRPFIHTCD